MTTKEIVNTIMIVCAVLYFSTIFFQKKISKKMDIAMRIGFAVMMCLYIIYINVYT